MNFEQRCAIAAACLPRDEYRASLERLHAEMLAAIADLEPLTDDQIDTEIAVHVDPVATYHKLLKFARAIEAAHGITGEEV